MTSALRLSGLSYRHPDAAQPVLTDVGLDLAEGRMTAVVGPSGSGKSTLLRLVAGLTRPDTGDVRVGDRSVLGLPPERRGMTMMFQKPHLFPHLDVLDNVAFAGRVAGRPRREAREAARRYLTLVHLGELASRRTRALSGGQEQRVALARALAAEPEVLLLDEPFSALDTELRSAMHRLLVEVRAALEPTLLMVTHDMAEAALADEVAVLVEGRLAQVGPVEELYSAPASVAVARVVGGFSEIGGVLTPAGHVSALGTLACGAATVTPAATLLLRQETVGVTDGTDPTATAVGTVVGTTRVGARQVVEVSVSHPRLPTAVVRAEVPLGTAARIGECVGLVVAPDAWCVPAAPAAGLAEAADG
jgi:putative spermidine/putrescine transport system ATP-binding protein